MYHTIGNHYEETKHLDIKEIAKLVRKDIKEAFPTIKTGVKIERFAGGQAINVEVKESDTPLKNPEYDGDFVWGIRVGNITSWKAEDEVKRHYMTQKGDEVENGIKKIIASYNYDDSDSMTDYFNVRFYSNVSVEC